MIVSESVAQLYWPGEPALGKCVIVGTREAPCALVVGVAKDAHRRGIIEPVTGQLYTPFAQWPDETPRSLIVRTSGDRTTAVTRAAEDIYRPLVTNMTGLRVTTFATVLEPQLRPWRLGATLFSALAALALVVAAVGVYSVVAFGVNQRLHEMGVRLALGARGRDIVDLVFGDGVRVIGIGILVGVATSLLARAPRGVAAVRRRAARRERPHRREHAALRRGRHRRVRRSSGCGGPRRSSDDAARRIDDQCGTRLPRGVFFRKGGESPMRFHTYSKFSPELADAVDLQALLDQLADFLLQSGFAGGDDQSYYGWDFGDDERPLARRAAAGDPRRADGVRAVHARDARGAARRAATTEAQAKLAKLLDEIVQRLIEEGYLNVEHAAADARRPPAGDGPGQPGAGRRARRAVQPHREGHRLPRLQDAAQPARLASASRASAATTRRTSPPASRPTAWSKPYEFGDVLNLDVNETLKNALARTGKIEVPINLEYGDLMVHQAEYRSSLRDGADARLLALDDPLRRGPLHAGQEGRARAHAPDPHAVPRRHAPGRALPRLGRGDPARDAGARRRWGRTTRTPPRGSSWRAACCWRRRRTCGRSS